MNGNVFDYRSILTGVVCPDCGKKYAVKLSVDFLAQHQNEQIQCICVSCYKTRIVRIK
jgi:hypothetical protein